MDVVSGIGVYEAIAIGKIAYLEKNSQTVSKETISSVRAELVLFEKARQEALSQIDALYQQTVENVGMQEALIFEGHKMMLKDVEVNASITSMIEIQRVNAAYAVMQTAENMAKMFAMMDDVYMRARAADIRDVAGRVIDIITQEKKKVFELAEPAIVCADDLSPSETVLLDKKKVLAFVTRNGSFSSHTAILARTMGIPAIVDCGSAIDQSLDGKQAIVDGFTGLLYIDPDEETILELSKKQRKAESQSQKLQELRGKENITIDGKTISIMANIASPDDVPSVIENDAGGVGLFRSEFLYLERNELPNEEMQFEAYKDILSKLKNQRVIIRTFDLGADKQISYLDLGREENPAMGYRAIRICLTQQDMFITQLRALLRASVYGKLSILFPMIASVEEVIQIKEIIAHVKEKLAEENIPFADEIPLGVMIETPAAALIADRLAQEVDFFSVGTNDLTQYTLALDRQNPKLERFYDARHEAVLKLIRIATHSAHKHGKRIGICGELAADTALTRTWIEMGIDALSVAPTYVLGMRAHVRALDLSE